LYSLQPGLLVTALEVDSWVAQDERQRLNGCRRSTQWHTHTVSWTVNQSSVIMADHSDPGNTICWRWKGWEIKKNLFSYSLYLSSIWQQPVIVHVYKTSTYSTHHTRLHRCSVSHSHLCYHITNGIGIGTRIRIGAEKKYRVSEVSVNPGIGLSLLKYINI